MKKLILLLAIFVAAGAAAQGKPKHHWVMKDAGAFGYEAALSADEVRAGLTSKPLLMVHYRGKEADGSYGVDWRDGRILTVATCSAPCEFVKVQTFGGGPTYEPQVVRAAKGSVLAAIFQDAMAGYLDSPKAAPVVASQEPAIAAPPASAPATINPSFDCAKAAYDADRLICGDAELAQSDNAMAGLFVSTRQAVSKKLPSRYMAFMAEQRQRWTERSSKCHDKTCVAEWFTTRQQELERWQAMANAVR